MGHPFDALSERELRARTSVKWTRFPGDVLPCWVADMDFPVADPIRAAIVEFSQAGDLGYPPQAGLLGLREAVAERLTARHGLAVEPSHVHTTPGIIPGLYLACRALAGPGEQVVVQPPVYPPFFKAVEDSGRELLANPMNESGSGWRLDIAGLDEALGAESRLLMLCNPQNPTGRVFTREELEALAEVVLRHRLWVVSDELHADLVLDGRHVPFASLGPEVAERTVTLYGPTKAFNIAGLKIGFMVASNPKLLERLRVAARGLVVPGNVLAQAATLAAFRDGDQWLDSTLDYLRGNRDHLARRLERELPGVTVRPPEGTYLAWLDFRRLRLDRPAAQVLLEEARLGLNSGVDFGPDLEPGLEGFARLNFATSRGVLNQALDRMRAALAPAD